MKIDLKWEYNNVRIKERNEQKAAFIMLEGLFEPTVMFFGLTNLLATFQTMINKLLRNLINIEKVGSFINDIIMRTESEEEYDELVEEISRRLEENDLYVKLEKYRWKVSEVDFVGIVIRPEGIRIEKEKIKAVLDQPVSKSAKDVQKFLELAQLVQKICGRICEDSEAII